MKTLQLTFTNRSPKENDELFKTPNRFTSNKLKKDIHVTSQGQI